MKNEKNDSESLKNDSIKNNTQNDNDNKKDEIAKYGFYSNDKSHYFYNEDKLKEA